jgi:hypothetical protein
MAALPCGGHGHGRGSGPAAAACRTLATEAGSHQVPRPRGRPPILGAAAAHSPAVRPQADPGRAAWPMRPASRPLRPYPGGVTPPRDGQAWIPTWAMGTACWSPVAVLPWLTGQQVAPSPTTLPPPANCRRRRWQVACGPWTTASSVAVVPHPACLRRSGRTDRRPEASTLRLVSSAELPGVYRFQVQGRTHRPGPPGARGRGSRMTGLLGTGPRATPLRVAPGEARGHVVCSLAAQADRAAPDRRAVTAGRACRS